MDDLQLYRNATDTLRVDVTREGDVWIATVWDPENGAQLSEHSFGSWAEADDFAESECRKEPG